jgi:hypothetical protein
MPDPYPVSQSRQEKNIYYIPSSPHTPLLAAKNDFSFQANSLAGSKFIEGFEIQGAFIPGKHIGVTGSYFNADNEYNMNYKRFEAGAGYVTEFSRSLHFETYAGFGNGKIKNYHHTGSSSLNLTHFFLQPAIAIANEKKTLHFAFVSRFEGVNFKVTDTSFNTDREAFSANQLISLYDQPFHIMWQPGIVFRFGWKKLHFHSGYSYSADLTNPDLHRAKSIFSLGAIFQMNTGGKNAVRKEN